MTRARWGSYGGLKLLMANPWCESLDRQDGFTAGKHYQMDTVEICEDQFGSVTASDTSPLANAWKHHFYDELTEWEKFDHQRPGRFDHINDGFLHWKFEQERKRNHG